MENGGEGGAIGGHAGGLWYSQQPGGAESHLQALTCVTVYLHVLACTTHIRGPCGGQKTSNP